MSSAGGQYTPPVSNNRIYGMIGQSNMDGRGDPSELPAYLLGNLPNSCYWNGSAWAALTATVTSGTSQVGPIAEFAYRQHLKYPNDTLYFVFEAVGGTSLAVDWNPSTGARYAAFETKWNAAEPTITAIKMGVCWMQGERDSSDEAWSLAYEANEIAFISSVKTLTSTDNFIDGRIHDSLPIGTYPYFSNVRTAKDNVFSGGDSDGLIDTDAFVLKADSIHLSTAGQISLGLAFSNYF